MKGGEERGMDKERKGLRSPEKNFWRRHWVEVWWEVFLFPLGRALRRGLAPFPKFSKFKQQNGTFGWVYVTY